MECIVEYQFIHENGRCGVDFLAIKGAGRQQLRCY